MYVSLRYSGGFRIYKWGQGQGAEFVRGLKRRRHRGGAAWEGVSPPHWKSDAPSPEFFFFDSGSQNGDFRCILVTIFTVELFGLNAKASSRG